MVALLTNIENYYYINHTTYDRVYVDYSVCIFKLQIIYKFNIQVQDKQVWSIINTKSCILMNHTSVVTPFFDDKHREYTIFL